MLNYPAKVAVGTGLAFVFGTSVIGALRHREHGQVDYKLAAIMTVAMTLGIEGGKRVVFFLEATGMADLIVSVAYEIPALETVRIVLIFGAAVFVSGAVVLAAVCRLRDATSGRWCRLTTS